MRKYSFIEVPKAHVDLSNYIIQTLEVKSVNKNEIINHDHPWNEPFSIITHVAVLENGEEVNVASTVKVGDFVIYDVACDQYDVIKDLRNLKLVD